MHFPFHVTIHSHSTRMRKKQPVKQPAEAEPIHFFAYVCVGTHIFLFHKLSYYNLKTPNKLEIGSVSGCFAITVIAVLL